ncbi:MAG: LPS translocon maturation chaperone LptM [Bacillota bacterium]
MIRALAAALSLCALLGIAACGQKGPLKLPSPPPASGTPPTT